MTTTDVLAGPLFESEHRTHLRNAVAASTVGTRSSGTISYFTASSPALFSAYRSFRIPIPDRRAASIRDPYRGFIARPVDAFIFGH
jgi:hypothetical protein